MKPLLAAFLICHNLIHAGTPWDTLPAQDCRNGEHTLSTLLAIAERAKSMTLRIVDINGTHRCFATRISPALALGKTSDLPKAILFEKGENLSRPLKILKTWKNWDLSALEISPEDATPFTLPPSANLSKNPSHGTWLISASRSHSAISLGNISAYSRKLPHSGSSLGILMGKTDGTGVTINLVSRIGPAGIAGLQADDTIHYGNGHPIHTRLQLVDFISSHSPGDLVTLGILRQGRPIQLPIILASQHRVLRDFLLDPRYASPASSRTDGFPKIIQHDTTLSPQEMGGPVFDIDGLFIGINIARHDRVTTYTAPWQLIAPLIKKLKTPAP